MLKVISPHNNFELFRSLGPKWPVSPLTSNSISLHGGTRDVQKFWFEDLKERDYLGDLGIGVIIILKGVLRNYT